VQLLLKATNSQSWIMEDTVERCCLPEKFISQNTHKYCSRASIT